MELDRQAVLSRYRDAGEQVLERLGRRVLEDCGEFVPVDTGALRRSGAVERQPDGAVRVAWDRGYARRLYRGVGTDGRALRYATGKNPAARKEWFEAAKAKHAGWQAEARRLFGGGG